MATEKNAIPLRRRAAVVGITLLFLLIPLALYYVFYFLAQEAYFTDRTHRSLASIAAQMASRINNLEKVVRTAATNACEDSEDGDLSDLEDYFNKVASKAFGTSFTFRANRLSSEELNSQKPPAAPPVTVNFEKRAAEDRLVLKYEVIAKTEGSEDLRRGRFSVSGTTDDLLAPVAERYVIRQRQPSGEDLFDKVLVADSETKVVVFQRGPDLPLSVFNTDDLVNAYNVGEKGKASETASELRARIGREMSGMLTITIAQVEYKLFFQPIELALAKSEANGLKPCTLTVFGLVRSDHAMKKSLAFSSYVWLTFAVMTLLVVTGSGPLFKLKLLGPKDRIRKSDGVLIAVAAYFVTALLTLAILNVHTHTTVNGQLDDQLKRLSGKISSDLKLELTNAISQLDNFNEKLDQSLNDAETKQCAGSVLYRYVDKILDHPSIMTLASADYPYFNSVTWIDRNGQQRIKFTSRELPSSFIKVDSRPYFREPKDGRLWKLTYDCPGNEPRTFYLESVNSLTSGENVAVISKTRSPKKKEPNVHAIIDKVDLEPNDTAPERVQIWGTFALADKDADDKYQPPKRGYLYYALDPGRQDACRKEWADLKREADSETIFGFGTRGASVRFREPSEKPEDPDLYSVDNGFLKRRKPGQRREAIVDSLSAASNESEPYVSAMDTRLLSLYIPVLPVGYAFCVIDASGEVLFHSDDLKNLWENLFDETRNDQGLRAATSARTSELLDVKYLGRDHRAYVAPIESPPWTLVVLQDKQMMRTTNLEMMTLAGIASLFYAGLLALSLAFIFVWLPGSKQRREFVWPSEARHNSYKQVLILNSGLFGICMLLVGTTGGGGLILLAILFPTLAIVNSLLSLGKPGSGLLKLPRVSWPSDWRRAYVLAWVSMLAVGCIAPTIAFFKLMREEQINVFLRQAQMSLADRLQQRDSRVGKLYTPLFESLSNEATSKMEAFINDRLKKTWDVDGDFFFELTREERDKFDDEPLDGFVNWFLYTFSPYYNEVCVNSLPLIRGKSTDKSWRSSANDGSLELAVRQIKPTDTQSTVDSHTHPKDKTSASNNAESEKWLVLITNQPAFVSFSILGTWIMFLVFGLLLIGAYFAVRFAARRIFLLDLKNPQTSMVYSTDRIDRNYLAVGTLGHPGLFPEDRFLYIDFAKSSADKWWKVTARIEKDESNRVVVLNHFESNKSDKDDTEWNQLKLELVEKLLIKPRRRVVIISSSYPVALPLPDTNKDGRAGRVSSGAIQSGSGGAAAALSANERLSQPWETALSSFERVKLQMRPDGPQPTAVFVCEVPRRPNRSTGVANADDEEANAAAADESSLFYGGIWSACSDGEKLTLYHVAKDGLVGRLDPDLRSLMKRGLIVRDAEPNDIEDDNASTRQDASRIPDASLGLKDRGFRAFVLRTADEEGLNLRQAIEPSHWERWKIPLLFVLLGAIAFLFVTQRELLDNTVSLVTAVTGGLLALFRLVGVLGPKGGASSDSNT